MKNETQKILSLISDIDIKSNPELFKDSAYNIREDCSSITRHSTKNVKIENLSDKSGISITVAPNTLNEAIYIPACITKSGINDLVYNDFYIGENSDITIVAGCGIHSDGHEDSMHNGIHTFRLSKNAKVLYIEKHIGTGNSISKKEINPVTNIFLNEGASFEIDSVQIGGVTNSERKTFVDMKEESNLLIRERIMTDNNENAKSEFTVNINGENAKVNLVSRSVAKGESIQTFNSEIIGAAKCTGHSECDGIIVDNGQISATPSLIAKTPEAALIHEAAIGKIAGEQLIKLMSLGLTEKEAESTIIKGFLK